MKAQTARTMEIPAEEKKLERQLCFAVYSTAHAFTRAYKPILDKVGLTYPQYLAMLVLWEKSELPAHGSWKALAKISSLHCAIFRAFIARTRFPTPKASKRLANYFCAKGSSPLARMTGALSLPRSSLRATA